MIEQVVLPTTREEILMWALGNQLAPDQSYARWHALEYGEFVSDLSQANHAGISAKGAHLDRLQLYTTELKRIRTWAEQMVIQFPELTEVRVSTLGARIYVAGVYIV